VIDANDSHVITELIQEIGKVHHQLDIFTTLSKGYNTLIELKNLYNISHPQNMLHYYNSYKIK